MSGRSSEYSWGAVKSVLIVQAVVSALIAISVIGAVIITGIGEDNAEVKKELIEILKTWGGVIIGFYFGTAYTQIATLVRAFEGSDHDERGTVKKPDEDNTGGG